MSEYWVSQGRKMCTYCKCWTADNKASINFHEQGKNHKENVRLKLDELRKKGLEDARKKETEISDLAKIEKAAMAAYKKDMLESDGAAKGYGTPKIAVKDEAVVSKTVPAAVTKTVPAAVTGASKAVPSKSQPGGAASDGDWASAYTDDGHLYYWNSVTNETSWYAPNQQTEAIPEQSAPVKEVKKRKPAKRSATTGYGQWETVETDEPEVADYDLPNDSKNNLSEDPEDIPLPPSSEPDISKTAEKEEVKERTAKFKVKEVSLGVTNKDNQPVAFKKRKIGKQRQARGNLDDD